MYSGRLSSQIPRRRFSSFNKLLAGIYTRAGILTEDSVLKNLPNLILYWAIFLIRYLLHYSCVAMTSMPQPSWLPKS